MSMQNRTLPIDFDLLSRPMQQQIQARIARNNGARGPVVDAVRAELAHLDTSPEAKIDANRRSYQAQRALLVAQLDYLMKLGEVQQAGEQPQTQSFWSRFRRGQQRTQVVE